MAPTNCILTTGNIMTSASEVLRRPPRSHSNSEFITSLRSNIKSTPLSPPPSPSIPAATTIFIPVLPSPRPLAEDRSEYDITVKLFHLPSAPASSHGVHTRDAIERVLKTLGTSTIDLVILSLPSINFGADDSAEPEADEVVASWATSYSALEKLHASGTVGRLGVSEFGSVKLSQLLQHTKVKPRVNQINVRGCCVVPKPLILFAKRQGIELLTHNDGADVLPEESLRRLLMDEFPLLGKGKKVKPMWVVKYTAVVRSRGVVENKGYIAMAEIQ